MTYNKIVTGRFISRPNRFIANVEIEGEAHTVHVKNTGRCKELLIPGVRVYLHEPMSEGRKTKYDLVAVEKHTKSDTPLLINMDSQIVNYAAEEYLRRTLPSNAVIRREVKYKSSRFDFYFETEKEKAFLEIKGVTLENDGTALFPDAPTERGVKHLRELIDCLSEGYGAYLLFVIQMKGINSFMPNDKMHIEFGNALREAQKSGVKIMALDCIITPDSITLDKEVPVIL